MRLAFSLARANAGKSNDAKMAMMAITTSSSIKVNARVGVFRAIFIVFALFIADCPRMSMFCEKSLQSHSIPFGSI
jgi:hypothetical protein